MASLFFARSVDLYLKDGGNVSAWSCPTALSRPASTPGGARAEWTDHRRNNTLSVDFSYKTPWDLEKLDPNTFFPIPASVVFARRMATRLYRESPLDGKVSSVGWVRLAAPDVQRDPVLLADTSRGPSPYAKHYPSGSSSRTALPLLR